MVRYSPGGEGGSQFPSGPGARRGFRLVWMPGLGFPRFSSARSTKGALTSPRAVSLTARQRRASPPFPSRISPSRRSEPASPPLWCMGRWSAPAWLAAVGTRSRVGASAQLSLLLLCLHRGSMDQKCLFFLRYTYSETAFSLHLIRRHNVRAAAMARRVKNARCTGCAILHPPPHARWPGTILGSWLAGHCPWDLV